MNSNIKLAFIIFSILIFIVALLIWFSNTASTFRFAENEFSVGRQFEISKIEIGHPNQDQAIVFSLNEENLWQINGTEFANQPAVNQLLYVLRRMAARHPVSLQDLPGISHALDSAGVRVEVFARDYFVRIFNIRLFPYKRLVQSFLVGSDAPDNMGTYMKRPGTQKAFIVHITGDEGGLSHYFEGDIDDWRSPMVFDLVRENIRSVTVRMINQPQESFTLEQNTDGAFVFLYADTKTTIDIQAIDTARVVRFLSSFDGINYERLIDQAQQDISQTKFESPFAELAVTSVGGQEYAIRTYRRKPLVDPIFIGDLPEYDPNLFYIQLADNQFATARYFEFSNILRPLSFFIPENQ